MHLRATEVVKRPALLERLSGLSVAEFERLLEPFSREYHQQVIEPRVTAPHRVRGLGGGQKGALPEVGDKLLFILMSTRLYPLLIVQGMFFGMAESKACKWVGILLPIVDAALGRSHLRPKRAQGRSLVEIIKEFPERKRIRGAYRWDRAAHPPPERRPEAERSVFGEEEASYQEARHPHAS